MNKIIVIAPHPDDETLGCGGTLLKHISQGDEVHWIIVTQMSKEIGFSEETIINRFAEIEKVANCYKFKCIHNCGFPVTRLDTIPMGEIIQKMSQFFNEIQPNIVYLPFKGDIHSDHRIAFYASISCTKWFRSPYIKRILLYKTLSETELGAASYDHGFIPNVFVDISEYINEKIKIMKIYKSELGDFPFPRSERAIRAEAEVFGAMSGHSAAEAFILLKEVL
jgi:N-acetylglucosamine malate deacetylase 1